MSAPEEHPVVGPHRNLFGADDPWGPGVYGVIDEAHAGRWLVVQMGTGVLSMFFLRRGRVVYVASLDEDGYIRPDKDEDDNGPAVIRDALPATIAGRLMQDGLVWKWVGGKKDPKRVECLFPGASIVAALELTEDMANLRGLRGVTHTPMVRKDGSILDTPGYDSASRFLYQPTVGVPLVPEHPTGEELAAAVALLRGMIDEFAWAGEHDEAGFLGALLTPLLRELCPPPYKLIGIKAHQRGSGKSLLAWIIRTVHGGVFRAEMPHDDGELEKVISSLLHCTTGAVVQFDNVSGVLRSSRLEGVLTSNVYSGRVLGSTNHVDMSNDRLWVITGNNLVLAGDLDRRALVITIDPMVEKPELRTGFRLDLEKDYVPANRGAILHALLVLVRAWVVAGMPMEKRASDSYAHWSAVVRGILQAAGVPGEFDHPDCAPEQSSADPEGWGEFLVAVRRTFGDRAWTVKELLTKVHDGREPWAGHPAYLQYDQAHPIPLEALPDEIAEKFARKGAAGASRSLGVWLRNRNRRFVGELAGVAAGRDRTNLARWRVLTSDEMRRRRGEAA